MPKNVTTAQWDGDFLIINWFGIPAHENDPAGARWNNGKLFFEGLSESNAWKLAEKPSPERALQLIANWQNYG